MKTKFPFQKVNRVQRVVSHPCFSSPIHPDVIHCVRDLKQMLRNPLVVRHDNVQVNRRQRTFVPKKMVSTPCHT